LITTELDRVSKYIISILYIFSAHGLCYTNPAYPKEHMDTIVKNKRSGLEVFLFYFLILIFLFDLFSFILFLELELG